jgi:hypothetical protein
MNTKYIHHFLPHSPFVYALLPSTVSTSRKDLFYPLSFIFQSVYGCPRGFPLGSSDKYTPCFGQINSLPLLTFPFTCKYWWICFHFLPWLSFSNVSLLVEFRSHCHLPSLVKAKAFQLGVIQNRISMSLSLCHSPKPGQHPREPDHPPCRVSVLSPQECHCLSSLIQN